MVNVTAASKPMGRPWSARGVAYWITTVLVAIAFVVPGIGNLVRAPHIAADMSHLGYPAYFLLLLGSWKILGAIAVVVPGYPRLKEWAYAGMVFDLTGAAASRMAMDDGTAKAAIPLAIALIVAVSWKLRSDGRVLPPAATDRGIDAGGFGA